MPGFVPVHLLLVPKMALPSLRHLTEMQREQIAAEVEQLAPEALENIGASESGFFVFVNGGPRQDVRQVHFHLVTEGYDLAHAPSGLPPGVWTELTDPTCELHRARAGDRPLLAGLTYAAEHYDVFQLERRGYTIAWDARARDSERVVHLTAGMPRALP